MRYLLIIWLIIFCSCHHYLKGGDIANGLREDSTNVDTAGARYDTLRDASDSVFDFDSVMTVVNIRDSAIIGTVDSSGTWTVANLNPKKRYAIRLGKGGKIWGPTITVDHVSEISGQIPKYCVDSIYAGWTAVDIHVQKPRLSKMKKIKSATIKGDNDGYFPFTTSDALDSQQYSPPLHMTSHGWKPYADTLTKAQKDTLSMTITRGNEIRFVSDVYYKGKHYKGDHFVAKAHRIEVAHVYQSGATEVSDTIESNLIKYDTHRCIIIVHKLISIGETEPPKYFYRNDTLPMLNCRVMDSLNRK